MSEVTIKRVQGFEELTRVMPLILEGFEQMNKRYKAFDLTAEQYTKEMIRITSQYDECIGVCWVGGEAVGYGVVRDNTERFSDVRTALFYALYVKPKFSRKCSKPLFEAAEGFAREQGYTRVVAYNGRFSGSGFRLFEKVFGMRRQMTRFNKIIN